MKVGGVLGADACPAGWVGVLVSDGRVRAVVHAEIDRLVALAAANGPLDAIAIDIPIGLADNGPRQADLLARKAAGPRSASVFLTPVRAALLAETYAAALGVSRELTGRGISSQAYRLRAKILQVDRWRRGTLSCPVVEAHPELSFAAMAGAPLRDSKSTWAGAVRRRQLLTGQGIDLDGDLGLSGLRVDVDDVLDAAAVAWTARRVADGGARRLPAVPERFSDGVDCAVWT
jgi:predicted RNase H-like nuclease